MSTKARHEVKGDAKGKFKSKSRNKSKLLKRFFADKLNPEALMTERMKKVLSDYADQPDSHSSNCSSGG